MMRTIARTTSDTALQSVPTAADETVLFRGAQPGVVYDHDVNLVATGYFPIPLGSRLA